MIRWRMGDHARKLARARCPDASPCHQQHAQKRAGLTRAVHLLRVFVRLVLPSSRSNGKSTSCLSRQVLMLM
jgi:hypothetical protein